LIAKTFGSQPKLHVEKFEPQSRISSQKEIKSMEIENLSFRKNAPLWEEQKSPTSALPKPQN